MVTQNRARQSVTMWSESAETLQSGSLLMHAMGRLTPSCRAKVSNFGTLQQEIKDAAALVNHNGTAFRNARITKEYIEARTQELVWAVQTHELREREREEQRQIREHMREEEHARKEYERYLEVLATGSLRCDYCPSRRLHQQLPALDLKRASERVKRIKRHGSNVSALNFVHIVSHQPSCGGRLLLRHAETRP
nr:DUF4041 domain-containing protein [uncultured Paraburkholderia sp.]